jgi:CRP-like cAMP-binding protein
MSVDHRNSDVIDVLAQVPLFSSLNRKALGKLAKLCVPKKFAAGALVLEEGKSGLGLFVITHGKVEVHVGEGESKVALATLNGGDIVGEMSLIDDSPRSATGTALSATDCLLITRDSFRTLVRKNADIAWCIVPVLADRIRTLNERLEHDAMAAHDTGASVSTTAAADETEASKAPAESIIDDQRLYKLLWIEYALLRAGIEGMNGSIGMVDTFLHKLIKTLPAAIGSSASDALAKGERLPERMVSTFLRERRRR